MNNNQIEQKLNKIIPKLTNSLYKGNCGKIGIIGGSIEYTGAPYFSGISSLRTGSDLCHIFCHKLASSSIKSYSPDLIVHPFENSESIPECILSWIDNLYTVVIGPGLGRSEELHQSLIILLEKIIDKNCYFVLMLMDFFI